MKDKETLLKELLEELELAQKHIDFAYDIIRLLLTREKRKPKKENGQPDR